LWAFEPFWASNRSAFPLVPFGSDWPIRLFCAPPVEPLGSLCDCCAREPECSFALPLVAAGPLAPGALPPCSLVPCAPAKPVPANMEARAVAISSLLFICVLLVRPAPPSFPVHSTFRFRRGSDECYETPRQHVG